MGCCRAAETLRAFAGLALLASKRGEQRQEFTTDNTEQDAWIVRAKTATEGVFAIKQEAKKSEGSRTFGFVT